MACHSSTMKQAKAILRHEMKEQLRKISEQERKAQSSIVQRKVLASEVYGASKRICVYLPMKDEINTLPLLESMFRDGKDCYIPHYKSSSMIMVKLNSWEEYDKLPVNNWGIKQPAVFDLSQDANCTGGLDLILMPGLAFTAQGVRLGRGKGYYDKYLQSCKDVGKLPHTVALAFLQQLQENIPSGEHDIIVNTIVFPTQDEIKEELLSEK